MGTAFSSESESEFNFIFFFKVKELLLIHERRALKFPRRQKRRAVSDLVEARRYAQFGWSSCVTGGPGLEEATPCAVLTS